MHEIKEKLVCAIEKRTVRSLFASRQDRKEILRMAATLAVITLVSAALLGVVHERTEAVILARMQEETEETMRGVLEADYYRDLMVDEGSSRVTAVYQAIEDGEGVGYVCFAEGSGFGGAMQLAVGVDMDGTVTGVRVLHHQETRSIGTRIVEDETVLDDLTGLRAPVIMKNGDEGFDAVSGATRSAGGVLQAVNAALDAVAAYEQEGGA